MEVVRSHILDVKYFEVRKFAVGLDMRERGDKMTPKFLSGAKRKKKKELSPTEMGESRVRGRASDDSLQNHWTV